jgi:tRNA pseudouridine32 synthase/23S rRNA pseudouridine746 synthase
MSGDNFFFTLDNSRHDVLNLKFPYPFYYWPDSIAQKAAEILMTFLGNKAENFGWEFGLNPNETYPRGRMFGVLVVENQAGKLGFLAAYSGNIPIPEKGFPFVPPVFDFWDNEVFLYFKCLGI